MLNLKSPLLDDYGSSMKSHLEAIETADEKELLQQLKQYISDDKFKRELKTLMGKAIRREWNTIVLQGRLKEQEEEA